ncbi:MAG: hypothetical protein CO164_05160, partial [Rhodocyclales bacterium CG_4_9_14_3_um_filter_68_10]
FGDHGNDHLDGGEGNDTLWGDGGSDTLLGGAGDDQLVGDADGLAAADQGDDYLDGGEGNDLLHGYGGNDLLYGGAGDDQLAGEEGNDLLDGEEGDDILNAGAGDDTLEGGAGADFLLGGAGNDTYVLDGLGDDVILDAEGSSVILAPAGARLDTAALEAPDGGGDVQVIFAGGTRVTLGSGLLDAHFAIRFDDGVQTSIAEWVPRALATPVTLSATDSGAVLQGGLMADTLIGGSGEDVLSGNAGADRLEGAQGADRLIGGEGDDVLDGGQGDDVLEGGPGNDTMEGGPGADRYRVGRGEGRDRITDGGLDAATDTVEFAAGIGVADVSFAHRDNGDLALAIGGETDALILPGWFLDSSRRVDSFAFADGTSVGAAELESLPVEGTVNYGTAMAETLVGGAGPDALYGLEGDDRLDGSGGDDTLSGGPGTDVYRFAPGGGRDRIVEIDGEASVLALDGLDPSSLLGSRSGDDLVLGVAGSDEALILDRHFVAPHDWRVRMPDGTERDLSGLLAENEARRAALDTVSRMKEDFLAGWRASETAALHAEGFESRGTDRFELAPRLGLHYSRSVVTYDRSATTYPAPTTSASVSVGPWIGAELNREAVSLSGAGPGGLPGLPPLGGGPGGTVQEFLGTVSQDITVAWNDPAVERSDHSDYIRVPVIDSDRYRWLTSHWPPGEPFSYDTVITGYRTELNEVTRNESVSALAAALDVRDPGGSAAAPDAYALGAAALAGATLPTQFAVDLARYSRRITAQDIEGTPEADWVELSLRFGGNVVEGGAGDDRILPSFYEDLSEWKHDSGRTGNFLNAGAGDDRLQGGAGADVVIGGAGDDLMGGGGGADRYVFLAGEPGVDLVFDSGYRHFTSAVDTIEFGPGVTPERLRFEWGQFYAPSAEYSIVSAQSGTRSHLTLDLSWDGQSWVKVGLPQPDDPAGTGIERFRFADGRTLGMDEMLALAALPAAERPAGYHGIHRLDGRIVEVDLTEDAGVLRGDGALNVLIGGGDDDEIHVGPGMNLVDAGDGLDRVFLRPGSETVYVQRAQPLPLLNETGSPPPAVRQTSIIGEGSLEVRTPGSDLTLGREGDDLTLGELRFVGWFAGAPHPAAALRVGSAAARVDLVELARRLEARHDGSVPAGVSVALSELSPDTAVLDTQAPAVLDRLAGLYQSDNGSFWGELGVPLRSQPFSPGMGAVTSATLGRFDLLEFADGIDPLDLALRHDGDDLVIALEGGENSLRLNHWYSEPRAIEAWFADGRRWDAADLTALAEGIYGTPGNETLSGGAGNDLLSGFGGADLLSGGAGDDLLRLWSDAVWTSAGGWAVNAGSPGVPGTLERVALTGKSRSHDVFDGGEGFDTLAGTDGADAIFLDDGISPAPVHGPRLAGIERIEAGAGDDIVDLTSWTYAYGDVTLLGGAGDDILWASAGNDEIEGGEGSDRLYGGAGSDTIEGDPAGASGNEKPLTSLEIVARGTAVDGVYPTMQVWLDGALAWETVVGNEAYATHALPAAALGTVVHRVEVAFTNDAWRPEVGEDRNLYVQRIIANGREIRPADPGAYYDRGTAAAAFDGLDVQPAGESLWTNGALRISLDGSDLLDGGPGIDTLIGGPGNDVYTPDRPEDVIVELPGEGEDLVRAGFSYALGPELEHLQLSGSAAANGTGNALDNTLLGNAAANALAGADGRDTLIGNDGDDRLDGGPGADILYGGRGDDTFVVENPGDSVRDWTGQGNDTVIASVNFALPPDVERLVLAGDAPLSGTGNILANKLTGNAAPNILRGLAGDDVLEGDPAAYTGRTEALESLVVWARATPAEGVYPVMQVWLDGALVQQFEVTTSDFSPFAVEPSLLGLPANGVDVVFTNDAWRPDLGEDRNLYVQKIVVDGREISSTGGGVYLDFGSGAAAFDGINAAFSWGGLSSNAALRFNLDAGDTLDGGSGADSMSAGPGNDTYIVDAPGDVVVELPGQGADLVKSAIDYTLGSNLEYLMLTGTAATAASGNAGDNLIRGNAGDNLIQGAGGNDNLEGGGGLDVLQGGEGTDVLRGAGFNAVLDGGAGNDTLWGGAGSELYVGGAGNDGINPFGGADVIAFNRGDGRDFVYASTGEDNTLSLGRGIGYADLRLGKTGNHLVVETGAGESLTLRDWYAADANHSVLTLQMVAEAMADFDSGGIDPLRDHKVESFDFPGLAAAFDDARAAEPSLTSWALADALTRFHLAGSDDSALGGDLAYR